MFVDPVKVQMDRVRFLSLAEATPATRLLEQHREIRNAVVARDAAAAAGAMERHLREILVSLPRLAQAHPDLFEDSRVPAHADRVVRLDDRRSRTAK